MWENLPLMLLEDIFCMLKKRDRLSASLTCQNWLSAFYCPRIWRNFEVTKNSFIHRRFYAYKGYQMEISHRRVQKCLAAIGGIIQGITIHPIPDYYNMSGFIRVLSAYLDFYEEYPMPLLESFRYTFPCENRSGTETLLVGTGGKILGDIKQMLSNLQDLRRLAVGQLLLDVADIPGLLECIENKCKQSLEVLELINCTKMPHPLQKVCLFPNLKSLIVSVQHLDVGTVLMLAGNGLEHLTIVQDEYTAPVQAIPYHVWKDVHSFAPCFRVTLQCRGRYKQEVLFQERAPVYAMVYDTPYSFVSAMTVLSVIEHYDKTLEVYAHKGLPRRHGSRSFHDRIDSSLVLLVRHCVNLQTLVIRDRISSCTLVIIVTEAKKLRKLHVRRNAVLKRFDWVKSDGWSDDFYALLKVCSRNLEMMEQYISEVFGYKWSPLSDKVFKQLKVI